MNTRKVGNTYWLEIVPRMWSPAAGSPPPSHATITHYPGNGFEAWVFPTLHGRRCLGSFKTFTHAARAVANTSPLSTTLSGAR